MRTIQVTGGNLYQIALQQLGDATQWARIAQQNNLLDPFLLGITTLKIPAVNPSLTGGILVPQ
jgi:hypothetical protein